MTGVDIPADDAPPPEILVFETGPLMHFACQSWLGVLKAVVGDRKALIPDVVSEELTEGAIRDDRVAAALNATWLERRSSVPRTRSRLSPSSPLSWSAASGTGGKPRFWHSRRPAAESRSSTTVRADMPRRPTG